MRCPPPISSPAASAAAGVRVRRSPAALRARQRGCAGSMLGDEISSSSTSPSATIRGRTAAVCPVASRKTSGRAGRRGELAGRAFTCQRQRVPHPSLPRLRGRVGRGKGATKAGAGCKAGHKAGHQLSLDHRANERRHEWREEDGEYRAGPMPNHTLPAGVTVSRWAAHILRDASAALCAAMPSG